MTSKEFAKQYVATLTDEELCAEILSWEFSRETTEEELLAAVKKNKISGFFRKHASATPPQQKIRRYKGA